MKRLALILGTLGLLGTGCTHRPTIHQAPDSAELVARQQSAARHLATAQTKFATATVGLRAIQASHTQAVAAQAEATRWVTLLVPAVDALLLQAPEDRKPEVEAIQQKVAALRAEIDRTTGEMAVTAHLLTTVAGVQADGTAALEQGAAELRAINAKLAPEHFAAVAALVGQANQESREKADWHNQHDALQRQGWGRKLLTGLGALAVAGLLFLWFTGRLAASTAALIR